MINRSFPRRVLMPGVCALLVACGDSAGTGTAPSGTPPPAAMAAAPMAGELRRPWVDLNGLNCLIADLPLHFAGADAAGGPVALTATTADMNVADLQTEVARVSPGPNEQVGLTFHYGMKVDPAGGAHALAYALELSILADRATYVEVRPQPGLFFELVDGGLRPVDKAGWYAQELGTYRGHVRVREQDTAAWEPYDPNTAYSSYTFPWQERMAALIAENPTAVKLRVLTLAEPLVRVKNPDGSYTEQQWRHIVGVAGVDAAGALLVDNADHGTQQFHMRALDLGSPCPPLCDGVAFFRTEGVLVRTECE